MGRRPRRTDLPFADLQRSFPQILDDPRGGLLHVDWLGQSASPDLAAAWLDEAELWCEARGPNLLAYEGGREQEGLLLAYHAYVPSWNLARLLRWSRQRGDGPLAPALAVWVTSEVLSSIHELHTTELAGAPLGFVHGSLGPDDVLVGLDGVIRVRGSAPLPPSPTLIEGTRPWHYLAPEQITGQGQAPRSDVYACGVMLWEMLTGERAFQSDSDLAVIARVHAGDLPPARVLRSELPEVLDALVRRATSLSPEQRPASADELRRALLAAVEPAQPAELLAWVTSLGAPLLHEELERSHARARTPPLPDDTGEAPRLGYRDNWAARPADARPATVRPAPAPRASWLSALWRRWRGR